MIQLDEEQKHFIIAHLASGVYPSAIVKIFQEEYGIVLSRQAIHAYDPRKLQGRKLSKDLKTFFYKLNRKHLERKAGIPVANQNTRLAVIDQQVDDAIAVGDIKSLVKLLDLARKETLEYHIPDDDHAEGTRSDNEEGDDREGDAEGTRSDNHE